MACARKSPLPSTKSKPLEGEKGLAYWCMPTVLRSFFFLTLCFSFYLFFFFFFFATFILFPLFLSFLMLARVVLW